MVVEAGPSVRAGPQLSRVGVDEHAARVTRTEAATTIAAILRTVLFRWRSGCTRRV
jgi:hypothetical protein